LRQRLRSCPRDTFATPFFQDYGKLEFNVKDPDGYLLLFAENVDPDKAVLWFN